LIAQAYLDGLDPKQRRGVEHWVAKDGAYGGSLWSLQAVEHQAELTDNPMRLSETRTEPVAAGPHQVGGAM
jgi:hypothetical protein